MDETRQLNVLVPLNEKQLTLLEWLGQWTPDIQRANWKKCRTWPPGFRRVPDLSVHYYPTSKEYQAAERTLSVPPESILRTAPGLVYTVLPYELVEGIASCCRLTPRGRAALKHHGRPCPDEFESHAPDVFDSVSLLPVVLRGMYEMGKNYKSAGTPMEDTPETWKELLAEYREEDYQGRHTITRANAILTQASSTGTSLNGSLRRHNTFLCLEIQSNSNRHICEIAFSLEGFADLLTSNSHVPTTVLSYTGNDGMRRSEPAAPPVSPSRRMRARLEGATDRATDLIQEIMTKVGGYKMGKKAKAELLHLLNVAKGNTDANLSYAAAQAVDEVSVAVESMLTVAVDRAKMAGASPLTLTSRGVLGALGDGTDGEED